MKQDGAGTPADFFVRLTVEHTRRLVWRHARTEIEEPGNDTRGNALDGQASTLGGYSDWVTDTDPPLLISWDWEMRATGELVFNPHSIRTNLMLVDAQGRDLGHSRTQALARECLSRLAWDRPLLDRLRNTP